MFERPTNTLIIVARLPALLVVLAFVLPMTSNAGMKIHDVDEIRYFSSTAEITNFFHKESVSIEVLKLDAFSTNNFILVAYPYSGSSTIDVFHFVKYGNGWNIKMVFFYLRPRHRRLQVEETKSSIWILDEKVELMAITVDQTLNSVER